MASPVLPAGALSLFSLGTPTNPLARIYCVPRIARRSVQRCAFAPFRSADRLINRPTVCSEPRSARRNRTAGIRLKIAIALLARLSLSRRVAKQTLAEHFQMRASGIFHSTKLLRPKNTLIRNYP